MRRLKFTVVLIAAAIAAAAFGAAVLVGRDGGADPTHPPVSGSPTHAGPRFVDLLGIGVNLGHSVTVLSDGSILIVGGRNKDDTGDLVNAIRFEPASGSISPVGDVPAPVGFHTATVLGDGNVLIVGGDVAAVFDPSTNVFTKVGDPLVPRKGHSAVLLANSTVLVAGGSSLGRFATSAEVYDPSVRQFRTAAPLSAPAPRPSLVAAGDGALLVTGDRIERYSPGNDTFTLVDVTLPASGPTVVRISEGLVLLTGGLSSEVLDRSGTVRASDLVALLDLTTGSIRTLGKMTTPRFLHTATLLEDGLVLITGGDSDSHRDETLASAELVDVSNGHATRVEDMAQARSAHQAVALSGGRAGIFGSASVSAEHPAEVFVR